MLKSATIDLSNNYFNIKPQKEHYQYLESYMQNVMLLFNFA